MPVIEFARYEDSFTIHFGTSGNRINAYTLATTLVGIADAARAANTAINPGYDIEVVVEALGSGSFKTTIRALYRGAGNLFSRDNLKGIVLGVIASAIYDHLLAPDPGVIVNVGSEEVIVTQGETQVVIPREMHDAAAMVKEIPQFRRSLAEAFRAVEDDPEISAIGFSPEPDVTEPWLNVLREQFDAIPGQLDEPVTDTREVTEEAVLEIMRAILERSRRRWEFAWRGIRIAAPILDEAFYERFRAHRVTIAPGDRLRVRLRIRQRRSPGTGVFINEAYEVVEVLDHISEPTQGEMQL